MAVRPIGAQLSARAVAGLGVNWVCAKMGEDIAVKNKTCDATNTIAKTGAKTSAKTSFFIGFARNR